jgi:transcriptional regulator with XRE-family HTH domain
MEPRPVSGPRPSVMLPGGAAHQAWAAPWCREPTSLGGSRNQPRIPRPKSKDMRATRKGVPTVSQAIRGATAPVSAAVRRKGFKAEMDGLRERMRALGFGFDEAAAEVSRRYQVRPRQAHRLARGWTQDQAAARFNELAAGEGTDPDGRASMTGPHLCEVEQWPNSDRRPSVYVLCLLARVYETDVLCLLDLADHESLPQQDRMVLMRCLPAPAQLGDVLDAGGELAALADAAALGGGPEPGQMSAAPVAGGMSLTLPYVPARLVIEVSGRAGAAGLAEGGGAAAATPGRLALVRGRSPQADGSEAG